VLPTASETVETMLCESYAQKKNSGKFYLQVTLWEEENRIFQIFVISCLINLHLAFCNANRWGDRRS